MNLWLGLNIKPIAPTTLKWTWFQFYVFHSTTLWYVVVVMVKKNRRYMCVCMYMHNGRISVCIYEGVDYDYMIQFSWKVKEPCYQQLVIG